MTAPEPVHAPNRIRSDFIMGGFALAQKDGIVLKVTEQANATRTDKRRWLVTLPAGTVVILTPSQAWAFLLGVASSEVAR